MQIWTRQDSSRRLYRWTILLYCPAGVLSHNVGAYLLSPDVFTKARVRVGLSADAEDTVAFVGPLFGGNHSILGGLC